MFFEKHMLPHSFRAYIKQDIEIRIILILSLVVIMVQYFIFKNMYPFPNFLPDSYTYIEAAFYNLDISIWPIGYSKFLRFVSVFNYTGMGLFFVQYVLLQGSILFFILTICFIVNPGRWLIRIMFGLMVLNPLWLYVSDFVSSDALFAALSLIWLTTLLLIIYSPTIDLLIVHGLVLFFVFSVRYNALYYPIFSFSVILLSKVRPRIKLLRLAIVCLPVLVFIGYTTSLYKKKYDTAQFSPFGGWQLASNAMYMYSHVAPNTPKKVPPSLAKLHALTLHHMDSLNNVNQFIRPDKILGPYYLWDANAPMKSYLVKYSIGDSTTPYIKKWAQLAPLYNEYGSWLIRQYPIEFARYYLLPNFINYYTPSQEFLAKYNMGDDTISSGAVDWFKYKTNKVHGYSKDKLISVTSIFPTSLAIINVLFISCFLGCLFLNVFSHINSTSKKILILLFLVWGANLTFSVIASPIVLRYQVFPFIFTLTFVIVLIGYLIKEKDKESTINENEKDMEADNLI
ncbi:hypothetical protein [Chitinophaga sancti]|uniref:Dolichyl-phosphate-mannose-protein mannosyltransferase n=1 Tax=Chitinophaga sancti TaxID=1004 RepID=A0A1K1T0E7_9BACT|nr:hypothetical protein [Chitinophaga sancti]WQD59565.1 hypothetical protein U0033_16855 [Chitinophaga sancti]WQG88301.1 hypothetical protein SR876_25610 [Chitinophaga sancti]SFW89964.1 hypothetical protein SAMN05661012_06531 [Chitinophaga sancti]